MLRESGWREEDGSEPSEWDDLSTRAEQRLGQLVREKYHTDYYILGQYRITLQLVSLTGVFRQVPTRGPAVLYHARSS